MNMPRANVSRALESRRLSQPWKRCVGVGRAYDILRADVQRHLGWLQKHIGYEYARFHAIFHDDIGVVSRQQDGTLAFRWQQVDQVYDTLLALGLRPFVEVNPMPGALASGQQTMFAYRMNVTPPARTVEWAELVSRFVGHLVERYGRDEVARWYFEVWNEPNLSGFFSGSQDNYFDMYASAANAIKEVDPRFRVGGPATSKCEWVTDLIGYCETSGTPIDFVSTHLYPQDEAVRYGDQNSPHLPGHFFADTIKSLRQELDATGNQGIELHITEWNTLSATEGGNVSWTANPSVDRVAAAATVVDSCLALDNHVKSLSWWVASDVFEEVAIPTTPFSCGYGLLSIDGIPKPAARAFEFLNRLRGDQLNVQWEDSERLPQGVGVAATEDESGIHVIAWFRTVAEATDETVSVELVVPGLGAHAESGTLPPLRHAIKRSIQGHEGGAYEMWLNLGRPENLGRDQLELLKASSFPLVRMETLGDGPLVVDLAPGDVILISLCRAAPEAALPSETAGEDAAAWDKLMGQKRRSDEHDEAIRRSAP